MRSTFLVAAFCVAAAAPAYADPQISVDEVSGGWRAISMSQDGVTKQMCLLLADHGTIAFRADDQHNVEIRTANDSWSLPADLRGTVTIRLGTSDTKFDVRTQDSTMLAGIVDHPAVAQVLDMMSFRSSMTLIYSPRQSVKVDLRGAARAINSFKTCAATNGFADFGPAVIGSATTPFQ